MRTRMRWVLAILPLVVVLGSVPGCSRFTSKKRPNLTPFAQHIITMSQDIQYGFSEGRVILLRRYRNDQEVAALGSRYREVADRIRRILRGIVAYSIEVVTIAQTTKEGPHQAEALANFLEAMTSPALASPGVKLHITEAELEAVLEDIRGRENLADALNAAQPVVDEVGRITGELLAKLEELQYRMRDEIGAIIDREHEVQLAFVGALKEQQVIALKSLTLLVQYISGDAQALSDLREHDRVLLRDVPAGREPNDKEMEMLLERLLGRLAKIEQVRESVRADLELYERELDELHKLINASETAARRARATALAWAQAHRKLAAGIVDPAEIDMMSISRSALRAFF